MNLECLNNINNQFISRTNSQKMLDIIVAALTNGFLKFLARFSGRRRLHRKQTEQQTNHLQEEQRQSMLCHNSHITNNSTNLKIPLFILLLLSTLCNLADACSSRTTPKPRPPTPTPRPNITFHTYKCPPAYAEWYCLNDATCFTVKIGESLLYNCECADGYMGPRCEYKDLDGSYLATRPRVMLETASIAGGAVSALFLALVIGFFAYVKWHQGKKREQLEGLYNMQSQQQHVNEMNGDGGHVNSVDVVDSVVNGDRCYCQNVQFSNLSSNPVSNQTNGDNIHEDLKHPQESQFSVTHHAHHHSVMVSHSHPLPPPQPKRPFGPHHYCSISMGDVIMKR